MLSELLYTYVILLLIVYFYRLHLLMLLCDKSDDRVFIQCNILVVVVTASGV